jgi:hypothetical protein
MPDLARLDEREGAGFAYRRVEVELDQGERAVAYEVIDKEPVEVAPAPEYTSLVLTGARERGLPEEWQAQLRGLLRHDYDDH